MTPTTQPTRTAPLEPGTGTPLEPTTPIRPSEAIRLGCLIAPVQAFGDYTDGDGTACVVGTMNMGYGFEPWRSVTDKITSRILMGVCPVTPCPPETRTFAAIPFHLNDDHRWSRERIADWLERLGL